MSTNVDIKPEDIALLIRDWYCERCRWNLPKDLFKSNHTLVVGCGHVGLPLLATLVSKNINAEGVDVKPANGNHFGQVVASPFKEAGLQELLDANIVKVWDYYSVSGIEFDNIIITVGTPIDKNHNPDTSQIKSAIKTLVENKNLTNKTLLILRSTLFPGATDWIAHMLKEEYTLVPDIVFAPERIAEGHSIEEISSIPQPIGGINEKSLHRASDFFNLFVERIIPMSNALACEFVKLFSNGYRYVNFALANEFAMKTAEVGVDYNEVLNAVNNGYKRGGLAKAALNVGGYCLAKDWCLMSHKSTVPSIVEKAYEVAEKTPVFFANLHKKDIENGTVGILGLAFKPGSDNPTDSLSYKMIKLAEQYRAFKIYTHDPYIQHPQYHQPLEEVLSRCTIIFVMTEHPEYKDLEFKSWQKVVRL